MQAALMTIGLAGMCAAGIASVWQWIAVMRRWNGVKAPETREERLARHEDIRRDPVFRRRERWWHAIFVSGLLISLGASWAIRMETSTTPLADLRALALSFICVMVVAMALRIAYARGARA